MKTARITKIEIDNGVSSITFNLGRNESPSDYELAQLGEYLQLISEFEDMAMFNGETALKVGDSITDDEGGQPIIGEVRSEAEQKSFSILKESDHRKAFAEKHGLDW